jgi:sterol desaturase/sphingolipid hydroxylase (fatty acid hydroxylase superfamily)
MIIGDFFFYWAHRVFHLPYFYKRFHKKHHEFKNTITLAAVKLIFKTYAHPVENLICNYITSVMGYIALGNYVLFL